MPPEELPAAPTAPVEPATPATPAAVAPAADPAPSSSAAPDGGAAAAPTDKAAAAAPKDFAPSLLDEAAKTPTADAKPDATPPQGEVKADEGKPPAAKEPAAPDKPAQQEKPDAKPAEAKPSKPADAKPAEPPAPIEYAFTRLDDKGERVPIAKDAFDPERYGQFTNVLQEARVPPEAAQKMIDMHLGELDRVQNLITERQWDVFAKQQDDWRSKVMADPELGGSRHATAITTVMGLIDAFSTRDTGTARTASEVTAERKDLMDVARMTGVANNPTWLRLLHWAGDRLKEGKARPAPPPRSPTPSREQRGLNRYANTTPAR